MGTLSLRLARTIPYPPSPSDGFYGLHFLIPEWPFLKEKKNEKEKKKKKCCTCNTSMPIPGMDWWERTVPVCLLVRKGVVYPRWYMPVRS